MTFMAMLGIMILVGVVVNIGIVLIAHVIDLLHAGMERTAAILQAGRDRLRPILMTTATTLLAMLPLAIGDATRSRAEKLQQELLEIWERTKVTVVFVTHSVEEAVVLADRIVVMTAGPGRIEHDSRVPLARPRDVSAIDFNQVRRDVTERLTSHVAVKSVPAAA